jgi:hypothetical protein
MPKTSGSAYFGNRAGWLRDLTANDTSSPKRRDNILRFVCSKINELIRLKGDWKLPVKRKPSPKLRPQPPAQEAQEAQELPPEMRLKNGRKKGEDAGATGRL